MRQAERKRIKREEAEERAQQRKERTAYGQWIKLDKEDCRATRERTRLWKKMTQAEQAKVVETGKNRELVKSLVGKG